MMRRGAASNVEGLRRNFLTRVRGALRSNERASGSHRDIFTNVYARNEWEGEESRSGPGSSRVRGGHFRSDLIALLDRFEIGTMIDAPCGDFNWMRDLLAARTTEYLGVDVVAELIEANRRAFSGEGIRFACRDLTRDPLPSADLILSRDCLVHFSFRDIERAIANFKRSGSRYLLMTSFGNVAQNSDIATGGWREVNFEAPPFSFPPPLAVIDEVPEGVRHLHPRKVLCMWELEEV